MKFEHTEVMNFEGAFRGLRNPMNSWAKSDSEFGISDIYGDENTEVLYAWLEKIFPTYNSFDSEQDEPNDYQEELDKTDEWLWKNGILNKDSKNDCVTYAFIGPVDMNLAQRMIAAGSPNDKFLRQIFVSVDITAPLYWWKEFDTYKVGTVANSTSTMHKLASTPITKDCFEMDDFNEDMMMYEEHPYNPDMLMSDFWNMFINDLEYLRQKYNETKDIKYWKELVRILPEGWLQTRTVTMNYSNLRNIVYWRKNHRLKYEWDSFIKWCQSLPYAEDLIFYHNGYDNGYELHNLLSQK